MTLREPVAGPIDMDDFLARARERLLPAPLALSGEDPFAEAGDHSLNPDHPPFHDRGATRAAAVLVPIVAHHDATVLLTQRAETLRNHSGQVAFPGGKIDKEDAGPLDAALREAEEEIGLDRLFVSPIGYLPPYLTGTGFRITPVVGLVRPGFSLTLNSHEVSDAFETPLGFLMDAANHVQASREWHGLQRSFYRMPYGERDIWGATAGIIRLLYDRMYGS